MNLIKRTVQDIKALRIQGAQNIAKSAVIVLAKYLQQHPELKDSQVYDIMTDLIEARPTEPALRNALKYFILMGGRDTPASAAKKVVQYFSNSEEQIHKYVRKILKKEHQYFTHCHSSTVTKSFIANKDKKIIVANTETRPLFQGRRTALELSKAGIQVIHSVDSAARLLIKDSSAIFLGCDSILNDGTVINKIGSEMFAEIAKQRKIPVYILGSGFKFSAKTAQGYQEIIEERSTSEVWSQHKNIHILNYAFEKINHKNITAVISELGVLTPKAFVRAVKQKYHWLLPL